MEENETCTNCNQGFLYKAIEPREIKLLKYTIKYEVENIICSFCKKRGIDSYWFNLYHLLTRTIILIKEPYDIKTVRACYFETVTAEEEFENLTGKPDSFFAKGALQIEFNLNIIDKIKEVLKNTYELNAKQFDSIENIMEIYKNKNQKNIKIFINNNNEI